MQLLTRHIYHNYTYTTISTTPHTKLSSLHTMQKPSDLLPLRSLLPCENKSCTFSPLSYSTTRDEFCIHQVLECVSLSWKTSVGSWGYHQASHWWVKQLRQPQRLHTSRTVTKDKNVELCCANTTQDVEQEFTGKNFRCVQIYRVITYVLTTLAKRYFFISCSNVIFFIYSSLPSK